MEGSDPRYYLDTGCRSIRADFMLLWLLEDYFLYGDQGTGTADPCGFFPDPTEMRVIRGVDWALEIKVEKVEAEISRELIPAKDSITIPRVHRPWVGRPHALLKPKNRGPPSRKLTKAKRHEADMLAKAKQVSDWMKWMKHDCDANRSPKLEKLFMVHGAAGYGLYWLIVELIGDPIDKDNISFKLKHDTSILAHRCKLDESQVIEMIDWMIDETLFERHPTTGNITCWKLAERIDTSLVRNPQLKIIQKRIRSEILINPESFGDIPNDSELLLLDVDLDLDSDSDGPAATAMKLSWYPCERIVNALKYHYSIDEQMIDEYMPSFQEYWIKSKKKRLSWDSVFYKQCADEYKKGKK